MRAGTAVPGTSNQEEEAGASVAENETQVAALDLLGKAFYPENEIAPRFPVERCVNH